MQKFSRRLQNHNIPLTVYAILSCGTLATAVVFAADFSLVLWLTARSVRYCQQSDNYRYHHHHQNNGENKRAKWKHHLDGKLIGRLFRA